VRVLVVNAGSTGIKFLLVDEHDEVEQVEGLDRVPPGVGAVAHRIVHGGPRLREPVIIDEAIERELELLSELAPLHNAPARAAIDAARQALPDIPQVAAFDTAFHATLPEEAYTFALPLRLRDELGIRRFGFHGLSVQWVVERVRVPRLVVCHLGGGCSVTAVLDGRSVDTSMGLTPLDGVPMATRPGSLDPGVVLHLLRTGTSVDELERLLEHESGLRGVSGLSGDVRELEQAGTAQAQLALTLLARAVAKAVAGAATVLGGLDGLAFTGGIGEHSASVRADVCARLGVLGVELDPELNRLAVPDTDVHAASSSVRVAVIRAREELVLARAARVLLQR
jgi:acetate kinase